MGIESGPKNSESIESRIDTMIGKTSSLEEVSTMLRGLAVVQPKLHDEETGNDLDTERVARALLSGDGPTIADEVPVRIIRKLDEMGFLN